MRKIVKVGRSYLLCLSLLVAITAVAESAYAAPEVIYIPADFPGRCAVNLTSDRLECPPDSAIHARPQSFCRSDLRGLDIVRGVLGLKTCAGDILDDTGSTALDLVLLVDDLRASEALMRNFKPVVRDIGYGSMIVPTRAPFKDTNERLRNPVLVVGESMFAKGAENGEPFTEETWRRRIESLLADASAGQARLSESGGGTEQEANDVDRTSSASSATSGDTGDEAEVSSSDEPARSRKRRRSSGGSGTYRQQRIIKVPFDDNRSLFLRRVRDKIDDWMVRKRAHNFVFDSRELIAIHDKLDNAGTQAGSSVKLYVNLIRRRSDRRIMKVLFGQ